MCLAADEDEGDSEDHDQEGDGELSTEASEEDERRHG